MINNILFLILEQKTFIMLKSLPILTLLSLIFAVCHPTSSFAQTTKTVDIFSKGKAHMSASFITYENNETIRIVLIGQDSRYNALISHVVLMSGTPNECYDFLSEVEQFSATNEAQTSTVIDDRSVSLWRMSMMDYVVLYEQDNGSGYHMFRPKQITQFKEKLGDWMRGQGISL